MLPSETRPTFYTLRTTCDREATIHIPPGGDPWQAATLHARAAFASDSELAELRIASDAETTTMQPQLEAAH
jgi:hypothetical protein